MLAVAYQVYEKGLGPAGMELFDISKPEEPKSIGFHSTAGPHSRGMHCLWFVDGKTVHCSSGAPDFEPKHPRDDQFYQILDVKTQAKLKKLVDGGYLEQVGDVEELPPRINPEEGVDPMGSDAFRLHNVNVYEERPDRAYLGYIDGGVFILDISDKSSPKVVSNWIL